MIVGMEQTKNVKSYASYLEERALGYRDLGFDLFRNTQKLSADFQILEKQMLIVQRMVQKALETRYFVDTVNNDVTLETVRLISKDLLLLFQAYNQCASLLLSTCPTFLYYYF